MDNSRARLGITIDRQPYNRGWEAFANADGEISSPTPFVAGGGL
jgi:hypothetical protein